MAWNIIEEKPNWEYSDTPNTDKKPIDHYDYDNNTVHTNGYVKIFSGKKFVLARQRFHAQPGYGELYVKSAPISAIYDSGNVAWTYTLPDDTETRNATGWEAGEANLFYDASGVPITVTGADILADQFINTWNVFFVEFDEFLETGRLIIYPEDISYSEAAALMRKHGLPVMISLYINEEILTINGEILTINQI
ncbi:MAG: hypothetical protein PHS04_00370 [Tissierellia bacterium]|nr:hypothetical protein [Tissierellia bacterium]